MKYTAHTILKVLSRVRTFFQSENITRDFNSCDPIVSALYSSDQMNRHGELLARSHKLLKKSPPDQLLKRLEDNKKTLQEVRKLLVESIKSGKTVTPASDWILDNFYLIDEQIAIARKHFPKGYSEDLPHLANDNSFGMPRVYNMVLEIISHSDGRIHIKYLWSFIEAYQKHALLTLGELWAIPIMLRLAVIENLRRVSQKIALHVADRNLADFWAEKLIETVQEDPGNLILTVSDLARSKPQLSGSFVAAFTRNLQGKEPAMALPLSWMEQQLAGNGLRSSELIRQENQRQATDQVSVRNCIGTLRIIGATDWQEFVESLSSVEKVLIQDVSGVYPMMDFATRDQYRHVVESISKVSPLSETEVAEKVLELSKKLPGNGPKSKRYRHIGYFLINKGLLQTEQAAQVKLTIWRKLIRIIKHRSVALYLWSINFLTLLIAGGLCYLAYHFGVYNWVLLSALGILSASCFSQLAVSLVNWVSSILLEPRILPRMDFSKGIPDEYRTLVVVPTMLSGKDYIEEQIDALEIRFLANKEDNLHFGLLTDFMDANDEKMPEDDALLELAKTRVEELNEKYKHEKYDIFFLFHRPRKWNAREKKWMGYERKRGKLSALNALIKGKGSEEFSLIIGKYQILQSIKYVITLDSDTELPRDVAVKLIATMAHPLNQAVYSRKKKRVIEGYGILQPRVACSMPKSGTSLYLRMQGDSTGIDPYTKISSDVYQDLFGEGSFIGKGIYDVDIFEKAVNNVFPDNHILSHDLIEGCYVRCGLMSDVLIYEDSPTKYFSDIKRRHRWIRGDWQIFAWMTFFVRHGDGRLAKNRLSALSRWKIFDNLRRSLLPVSFLMFLLMGWFLLPFPLLWTLAIVAIILLPVLVEACWKLAHKPIDLPYKSHFYEVGGNIKEALSRFLFGLTVLPYEAFKYSDAVFRTIWRMLVSHKKLLEWTPYSNSTQNTRDDILSAYISMWRAPVMAFICTLLFLYTNPVVLFVSSPILIFWLIAPAITWWISMPETAEVQSLSEEQTLFLHKSARKTWAYFEQFVTATDNWLPPDNFQQEPNAVIAHRTSPTNIGLYLLANLSAYDFGYINISELMLRCHNTLQTMLKLERYEGHLYNWYDTESLVPLHPRYVSTVDSGNLTGFLLTLKQGILQLPSAPIFNTRIYQGIRTTVALIRDINKGHRTSVINKMIDLLDSAIDENSSSLYIIKKHIDEIMLLSNELMADMPADESELFKWTNRLSLQIQRIRDDMRQLIPWLELLPAPEELSHFSADNIPSLMSIQNMPNEFLQHIKNNEHLNKSPEEKEWLVTMQAFLAMGASLASERIRLLQQMAEQCEQLSDVEYDFLYDEPTSLLRIGYNVEEQRKDNSFYDLLASEARFGIFIAIAQGKLPQECWFALGRQLTNFGGDVLLISWSGSMFEYLMPQLVMPVYENTLLYQTSKISVKRQIEYAGQRKIPWGMSESAYNLVDANLTYQYKAFGVPGIGLKRGLDEDTVIAPYASMLALMISPRKACANLQLMYKMGFEGEFGFFESIDYTPNRLPRGKTHSIVYTYMSHHQGMGLLSLAYQLLDKPMQQRFISELRFQATLLLLHERIPRDKIIYANTADLVEEHPIVADVPLRKSTTANTMVPEIQLLSNGNYHVMITNSGGGYSRWKDIAITRWREDTTKDNMGIFCYIKDTGTGNFWSNTYQPTLHTPKNYEVIFSQGRVEFHRQDYGIETITELVISPEEDAEIRKIRLKNRTASVKVLEITSYAEVVVATQAADEAHTAFSNLFVETEIFPEQKAIICTRRPRSMEEKPLWLFHQMEVHHADVEAVSYETDRMQFIGRGNSLVHPQAMDIDTLSGHQGSVLDPITAIRYRIIIQPNQTARIDMIYGISETKKDCQKTMYKFLDRHLKNRAFELSWTHSQIMLQQINATEADAQLYTKLATSVIYTNNDMRADSTVIQSNLRGQSGLWAHSVSGDLPIVLLHISEPESMELVKQMVQAHSFWRQKGLSVDLVILNDNHGSYRQPLQEQIFGLITAEAGNNPGNIFLKSVDQLSTEDRLLFESVARVVIHDDKGTLSEQVNAHFKEKKLPPLIKPKRVTSLMAKHELTLPENLIFYNGMGGFTPDGKEYKICTNKKENTPAPWANVIANPNFGSVISESGSAYTWAVNAHEYRLTPWSNDPVSDAGGEAFYLRDEETGAFWSPTPYPAGGVSSYVTTHGFGYSIFEHSEQGIFSEMCEFVDTVLPVKFIVLKIVNKSGFRRKLSATGFMEIIMGDLRSRTNIHIFSEHDTESNALMIRNTYNSVFADRVTFFKTNGELDSFTTDRSEFIGRNRNLSDPKAMSRTKFSDRNGACMDPCAVLHVKLDLIEGAEKEIVFLIGNEKNTQAARALIQKFDDIDSVMQSLNNVKEYWKEILGAVTITTPDNALNIMANGWLIYQTLASRIFARSGFYQSGGAFGFRDQLQDVLALLHTKPGMAREHILLCASRQFSEGDVQHWWHPPEGKGVRTHCSDDLLWLPFVVSRYIMATGDVKILSATSVFLKSRTLHPEEDSIYDLPVKSKRRVPLYEHCVRAIKRSLSFGEHGLPLIGSGDWNDGMDKVGNKGKGESIWLAFFQYDILMQFAGIADAYGDIPFAEICKKEAEGLRSNIENFGWDGQWYMRAYFDDGTPLGSKVNKECSIDSIAQSWSVLSGAAEAKRKSMAMASLDKYLVKRDLKIIKLLDPSFDTADLNPGYIMGYPPGVRENGGQYSHAAIWATMAFAVLGDREKVWELYNMINPVNHASDNASMKNYKVEPYVMAADVYANESHRGMGGWTWYTGSSGWMYQFIIGSLLGMQLKKDHLIFNPCFPLDWPSASIVYRYGKSTYHFTVFQIAENTASWWKSESKQGEGNNIKLIDDGLDHKVSVYISIRK